MASVESYKVCACATPNCKYYTKLNKKPYEEEKTKLCEKIQNQMQRACACVAASELFIKQCINYNCSCFICFNEVYCICNCFLIIPFRFLDIICNCHNGCADNFVCFQRSPFLFCAFFIFDLRF